jgi:hypothetical protein
MAGALSGNTRMAVQSPLYHHELRAGGVMPTGRSSALSPRFGEIAPRVSPNVENAIFETYTPRPVRVLQKFTYWLNRMLVLNPWFPFRVWKSVKVKTPDPESLENLKSAGKNNAGVLLVTPHPENMDGYVLAEIHRQANQYPACIPVSSEIFMKFSNYVSPTFMFLLKPLFSILGLMPVNRGGKNDKVKKCGIESLAQGKWMSAMAEGACNINGPRTFPMQKGSIEMALQAAIQSNFERPVNLVRSAHVWHYTEPEKAEKAMRKALKTLERSVKRKSGIQSEKSGDLQTEIFQVGSDLLDYKLYAHGIRPPEHWDAMDFYEKATYLHDQSLLKLERKYHMDATVAGHRLEHNRVMAVRSEAWKRLTDLPEKTRRQHRNEFVDDLRRTSELSYLATFTPKDLQDFGKNGTMDPEMLAIYVRRLWCLMGFQSEMFGGSRNKVFGSRAVSVKILPPLDMRPYARLYQEKSTQAEKDAYAIHLTQTLLQMPIQQEIKTLRDQEMVWR